jgi:Protein of unknown function (DUF3489)
MPKSNTPKLNDTQLIILSSAAQREDGLAILPESLRASAAKAAVTKLLALGFVKEVRVKRGEPAWRTDEQEKPLGFQITKLGSAAIGIPDEGASEEEPAPEPKSPRAKKQAPRSAKAGLPRAGSKQAQIIGLMKRKGGATLDEMVGATGWLPHTTRAALTGLRKKGYGLAKDQNAKGKTVYRIEDAAKTSGSAKDAA